MVFITDVIGEVHENLEVEDLQVLSVSRFVTGSTHGVYGSQVLAKTSSSLRKAVIHVRGKDFLERIDVRRFVVNVSRLDWALANGADGGPMLGCVKVPIMKELLIRGWSLRSAWRQNGAPFLWLQPQITTPPTC